MTPAKAPPAVIPAPRQPSEDISAAASLSEVLDFAASAAYVARMGEGYTDRLIGLASAAVARNFPAGGQVAEAFGVILAAIGGAS